MGHSCASQRHEILALRLNTHTKPEKCNLRLRPPPPPPSALTADAPTLRRARGVVPGALSVLGVGATFHGPGGDAPVAIRPAFFAASTDSGSA